MKIENEITGEIADVTGSYVGIRLHICSFDGITDFFAVDIEEKGILTRLNATTRILLNIEHTFEDYMNLIADLGLEIPESYKKHWTPKDNDTYYFLDRLGEVVLDTDINSFFQIGILENYNAFPTKELAEKAVNLSKLGRLILLWQYANDCLFTPDWRDSEQCKYYITYNYKYSEMRINIDFSVRQDKTYFETEEQAKTFIEMYETEIKKIME